MGALVTSHEAETSWLGIALTIGSAILMPAFGIAKRRVGEQLGSAATKAEGTQNILCASRWPFSRASSETRSLAPGGSTRSRACSSPT